MSEGTKAGIDHADIYDHEMATIERIGKRLAAKYGTKPESRGMYEEFAKEANHMFNEAGFVVQVDFMHKLLAIPGAYPTVDIIGKIPGHSDHEYGFDHERKRFEVLRSKDRGEAYDGQEKTWKD